MTYPMPNEQEIKQAADELNAHVVEIIKWHFSPETGCPFWLDWQRNKTGIQSRRFPILMTFAKSFQIFKMNGFAICPMMYGCRKLMRIGLLISSRLECTTGMPKQRIGWDDFRIDYTAFDTLSDEHFPRNHYWMMVGPTGPRRLRLAIEHLANERLLMLFRRLRSSLGETLNSWQAI